MTQAFFCHERRRYFILIKDWFHLWCFRHKKNLGNSLSQGAVWSLNSHILLIKKPFSSLSPQTGILLIKIFTQLCFFLLFSLWLLLSNGCWLIFCYFLGLISNYLQCHQEQSFEACGKFWWTCSAVSSFSLDNYGVQFNCETWFSCHLQVLSI